jgi:NAD(P)-dependent dehydrogenase (short-subunit alcohol dehydrogenase family)
MTSQDRVVSGSPDLSGRNCVVTGATSGIGRMAARGLAALRANLVLVGRNDQAGHDVVRWLHNFSPGSTINFVRADLSRQSDVRALAARIGETYERVDVLINNAGARFDDYYETEDGIEVTFATNHLGHFLLTGLLLDRLLRAPSARVITVASAAHHGATAEGGWYLQRGNYDRRKAYGKSKLANVMFARALAERLRTTRVTSNAVDPGSVATNFGRNNGYVAWLRHLVGSTLSRQLVSARAGADTVIYLSSAGDVAGISGKLFLRRREVEPSAASGDRAEAQRLWDLSERLTGLEVARGMPALQSR